MSKRLFVLNVSDKYDAGMFKDHTESFLRGLRFRGNPLVVKEVYVAADGKLKEVVPGTKLKLDLEKIHNEIQGVETEIYFRDERIIVLEKRQAAIQNQLTDQGATRTELRD